MLTRSDLLALQRATHAVLQCLDAELHELGMSASEVNALASLTANEAGMRIGELASATGQRASTATGIVDRLERRGMVERVADPADRRTVRVRLTDEGGTARDAALRGFDEIARRASAGLDRTEALSYRATLAALEQSGTPASGAKPALDPAER